MARATTVEPQTELAIFWDARQVGTLVNSDPLTFIYAADWLSDNGTPSLAPTIPKQAGPIATPEIHAFFENLLPEGEQRKLVSLRFHVSSVFGLLAKIGGDTAGAIVALPMGSLPQPPLYESVTWEDIDRQLHAAYRPGKQDETDATVVQDKYRMSISGAQFKILLSLDGHGNPLRPVGTTPSTLIVKPDIVRGDLRLFATAINETLVMQAARLCGLRVATVQYQPIAKACLVERYDRVVQPDGTLRRLWQADLCQLAGLPSSIKYEADNGPAFTQCYELVRKHSSTPAQDLKALLQWLFFNLFVGNNDSHAKNLSMLARGNEIRLAPFYDLMSTRVYSGLGANFAFSIGGEFEPGKIGRKHIDLLAGELRISERFIHALAVDMAGRVLSAVPTAAAALQPLAGPDELIMIERIALKIHTIATRTSARILATH